MFGEDGPAGEGAYPPGRHAARPSRPDPAYLPRPRPARRRPRRPGPNRPGQAGTKYHVAVDGDGVPVACAATAANVNDTVVFERLFLAAFAVMARIRTVFADTGYDAVRRRDLCRGFGAEPHIYKRGPPRGSGLGQRRWPVERSNAWVLENRRVGLRYDRLGFIVRSLLHAACIFLVAGRFVRQF
ncbi:MAG: transposase [Geminicoccaceae bacterium]